MSGPESIARLAALNERIGRENADLAARLRQTEKGGGSSSGGGDGMNIVEWRLAQAEKRADEMDARTKNIEQTLTEIRLSLATLATRDFMRNWALSLAAIIVATGVGLGAMLLQSSANQLSAFQAGLSAVQAASAVQGASAAKPSGH